MKSRKCAVAGQFYPDNAVETTKLINEIYNKEKSKINREFYSKDIIPQYGRQRIAHLGAYADEQNDA